MKKLKFEGLHCPNCARKLEEQINKLDSVKLAKINFLKEYIEFDSATPEKAEEDIVKLTHELEPDVKIFSKQKVLTKNLSSTFWF